MARMGADWEARAAEVGGRSVLCRAFRGERRPLAARRQAAALQAARRQAAALQWPFAVVVNLVDEVDDKVDDEGSQTRVEGGRRMA
jgi:hypothetical protein